MEGKEAGRGGEEGLTERGWKEKRQGEEERRD